MSSTMIRSAETGLDARGRHPSLAERVRSSGRAFRRSDLLLRIAVVILLALLFTALVAAVTGIAGSTSDTVGQRLQPPSAAFPLGTDNLGRSVLPRLLEGIGTTLLLSTIAVALSATISTVLGLVAGYVGGAVSESVLRVVDVIYAFPALILAILVSAVVGPGREAALVSIVLITIPLMTRMVRISARQTVGRDFVVAARISGVGAARILLTHLLPNAAGTIAVQASYALSVAILVEGGLSFLGYGVQVPGASLGLLIQDGMLYMSTAPWLLLAPGVVLVLAILCVNLIGDGLRDQFEPRETRSLS